MPDMLLSAYPALPADASPDDVRELYARLRDLPTVAAVELGLDADGDVPLADVVLPLLPDHWGVFLTTVPGTMVRLGLDRTFGLASDDAQGARDAQTHLTACLRTAARLDERLGRRAVRGIAVLSGPPLPRPSRDGAADRLLERLRAAWAAAPDPVRPLLEHCDALVAGQTAAKGFLDLDEEIRVVAALRRDGAPDAGLVVNWGRSALETRSVEGPVEHLARARAAGVLAALVLSGCTDTDGPFGPAWADTHLPTPDLPAPAGEPTSLMTEAEVSRCLTAAGPVPVVGTKFAVRPHELPAAARAEAVAAGFRRVAELAGAAR